MKISIITAFYQGNEYMKQYTDCVLANQKHLSKEDELEVILVNDSPDEAITLPMDGSQYNIWIVEQKEKGVHIQISNVNNRNMNRIKIEKLYVKWLRKYQITLLKM